MPKSLLKDVIVFQMRQILDKSRHSLTEDLTEIETTVTEASVLMVIQENKDITSSEIGRFLNIKRANMTPLISQLCKRGYIATNAKDGRSIALNLTDEGEKLCASAVDLLIEHDKDFLSELSENERNLLLSLLKRLNRSD